jgi:NADPH-dependent 2,4-dienoyl-CoA reductase/sulfur reductase-like enzyme
LWLASVDAAEPVSPLLGATRAQVLAQYGEPRSQIETGGRLIFLYPRERVTFRGDVVIDVEPIVPEPVRRPAPAEAPPPANSGSDPAASANPAAAPPEAAPGGPAPASAAATAVPPANSAPTLPAAPPPEPKVEIKLVRPPGSKDLPGAPSRSTPVAPEVPAPPPVATTPLATEPAPVPVSSTTLSEMNEARKAAERAAAAEKEQKDKARKEALRRLDEAARGQAPSGGTFSTSTWLMVVGALVVGVAFLFWLSRRGAVVSVPDAADKAVPGVGLGPGGESAAGNSFTPEMLEELEWSRFERLVVSYYSKTGVVAEPTNAGPDAPVQIRISWKGEPRPFAYVRCAANSSGLIDVKPLKELGAALAADDIRRGYVVTAGRFSPAARALAADQQLTLMPGEVLLEKLNALPLSARKELMRDTGLA